MIGELALAALGAWIISEVTDVSPRLALYLVHWAANHLYAANPERAKIRKEEWEALVRDGIPTKTATLFFGLALGGAGLYCLVIHRAPGALAVARRLMRRCVPSGETVWEWITAIIDRRKKAKTRGRDARLVISFLPDEQEVEMCTVGAELVIYLLPDE